MSMIPPTDRDDLKDFASNSSRRETERRLRELDGYKELAAQQAQINAMQNAMQNANNTGDFGPYGSGVSPDWAGQIAGIQRGPYQPGSLQPYRSEMMGMASAPNIAVSDTDEYVVISIRQQGHSTILCGVRDAAQLQSVITTLRAEINVTAVYIFKRMLAYKTKMEWEPIELERSEASGSEASQPGQAIALKGFGQP